MNKISCESQNTSPNLARWCLHLWSLWTAFTQLTADLTPEWSGGSMFHPLLPVYARTPFFGLKQLQTTLWIIDALLMNTLLSDIFNFNLNRSKRVYGVLGVFRESRWIWLTWAFSNICVSTTTFKSAYHLKTVLSNVAELLSLTSIFPIRKQCFINTRN